jgi:hypothetical protein
VKFYRIRTTEFLDDSMHGYTLYILPEDLEDIVAMFEKHKDFHHLGDPELVEVDEEDIGKAQMPGEKSRCLWIGG